MLTQFQKLKARLFGRKLANRYGIRPYTRFDQLRDALSLREFEPQSWRDWLIIPWSLIRWVFAWVWTQLWGIGLTIRYREFNGWHWMWGRRESPEPIICTRCLWAGAQRWCVHTYYGEDSEAVDECPRCGGMI